MENATDSGYFLRIELISVDDELFGWHSRPRSSRSTLKAVPSSWRGSVVKGPRKGSGDHRGTGLRSHSTFGGVKCPPSLVACPTRASRDAPTQAPRGRRVSARWLLGAFVFLELREGALGTQVVLDLELHVSLHERQVLGVGHTDAVGTGGEGREFERVARETGADDFR